MFTYVVMQLPDSGLIKPFNLPISLGLMMNCIVGVNLQDLLHALPWHGADLRSVIRQH